MNLKKIIKKMTLNVWTYTKISIELRIMIECQWRKNKKRNWAEAKLLDCDYNLL